MKYCTKRVGTMELDWALDLLKEFVTYITTEFDLKPSKSYHEIFISNEDPLYESSAEYIDSKLGDIFEDDFPRIEKILRELRFWHKDRPSEAVKLLEEMIDELEVYLRLRQL